MYQLMFSELTNKVDGVKKEFTSIPFAPDNIDYQQFKQDLTNGVELQDATGTPMTADAIATFLQGLQ